MTFDTDESSLESSEPIELYAFTLGLDSYGFTPSQIDKTIDSLTYISTGVRRDSIILGQSVRKRVLRIRVPQSNIFANLYAGIPPGLKASVSIYRMQSQDVSEQLVELFTGSVQSVEFPGDGFANIACLSIEGVVARSLMRVSHMGMCNHIIYGEGCNVDPSSHTLANREITAIDGNTITVDGVNASTFIFTGGFVRPSSSTVDPRVVLQQSGDDLRLMLPFRDLVVGSRVDVLRGCNHIIDEDCAVIFDNVIQNLSFSFVPNQNPWRKGLTQQ